MRVEEDLVWLDDLIEKIRERDPLLILGRIKEKRELIEMVKNAYYDGNYNKEMDKEEKRKLEAICQKLIDRMTFNTFQIKQNADNEEVTVVVELNNLVELYISFSKKNEKYNYKFVNKENEIILNGETINLDEVVDKWHEEIENLIR